jgi:hypothetical protein
VKVILLLADAAQAVEGKLNILGGGWSVTGPAPAPSAIAIKIEVPWDQANKRHRLELALRDADGQPVRVPTPMGEQAMTVAADFEVGRPPGLKPGTPLDVAMAINLGPIPLAPDRRYIWQCFINGETREDWSASFTTRPLPKQEEQHPPSPPAT